MPVYATAEQLGAFLAPEPAPANAARLLVRASRKVGRAVFCARYDVDTAGMPTDTKVAEAMKDATLEQISYWLDNGDDEGTAGAVTSASIGSAKVTRGGSSSGSGGAATGEDLCEQAWDALASVGLTGHGPRSC